MFGHSEKEYAGEKGKIQMQKNTDQLFFEDPKKNQKQQFV